MDISHFSPKVEAMFDIPFLVFLIFQAIAWCVVVIMIQHKNRKVMGIGAYIPLIISSIIIFITFVLLPGWRVHFSSIEGIFNIADTLIEIVAFIFAGIALFASEDRELGFLTSGFLLIIASDFFIRFAEVENSLFPSNWFESMWVLGLIVFVLGLLEFKDRGHYRFIRTTTAWNSIKAQNAYWQFVVLLILVIVFFLLNLGFSNLKIERSFDIPASLIVLAVLSTLFSNIVSTYFSLPFKHVSKLIIEHHKHHEVISDEIPTHISRIKEFNELDNCLRQGLDAIEGWAVKDKAISTEVLSYANEIRDPVAALRLIVKGAKIPEEEKKEIMNITAEINARTKQLLERTYPHTQKEPQPTIKGKPIIIVDDDEGLNIVWAREAKELKVNLEIYQSAHDFREAAPKIDKSAILYFDWHLTRGETGTALAEWAYNEGFRNIYLITRDPKLPEKSEHILGIIDKEKLSLKDEESNESTPN